jgi:hypothetical protein
MLCKERDKHKYRKKCDGQKQQQAKNLQNSDEKNEKEKIARGLPHCRRGRRTLQGKSEGHQQDGGNAQQHVKVPINEPWRRFDERCIDIVTKHPVVLVLFAPH